MRLAALPLALLLSTAPAAAQVEVPSPSPGTSVRISPTGTDASRGWVEGRVVFADADSLVVRRRDTRALATFGRGEIGALQVSRGRVGGGARLRRLAALGAGVGAVVGGAAGAISWDAEREKSREITLTPTRTAGGLVGGLLGVLPGAVLGGVAGLATMGERWLPAKLPATPRVAVGVDGGVAITVFLKRLPPLAAPSGRAG